MKLFQNTDFEQAILQAAEHFRGQGLRSAIIEKDYYVTEALRIIAASSSADADTASSKVIFKGGYQSVQRVEPAAGTPYARAGWSRSG